MRSINLAPLSRFSTSSLIGFLLFGSLFLFYTGCAKNVETIQESRETTPGSPVVPGEERPSPPTSQQRPLQEEVLTPAPPPALPSERAAPRGPAAKAAGLDDVFFDFDKWTLRPDAKTALEKNALWFAEHQDASMQIEGHCDERGTIEYNLALGERRAKAVKSYLVNLGVDAGRLSVISFGKEKPFCTEANESCFQKNRRGHFVMRRP